MGQQTYEVMEMEQPFSQFIWNSRTKEFLGRTGTSWGKIFVFYVIFYLFLAGFMSLTMFVLYSTLKEDLPTYNPGDGSSILKNPALGFRPLPPKDRIESTLIWFDVNKNTTYSDWTSSLDKYIEPYMNETRRKESKYVDCSKNPPADKKVCDFNPKVLGPCNKENEWGYPDGTPCVILKLNRMIFWKPDLYETDKDFVKYPVSDAAKTLMESNVVDGKFKKMVWVTCEGENEPDREYIKGINYYPQQGFSPNFYPYSNQDGYYAPIIAVHFSDVQRNILINVECKVWAKNIKHVRKTKLGIAHFELLVDEKKE